MTKGTSPSRLKPLKAVVLVALLMASAVTPGVLAAEYTVTDLGTLGGSDSFAAGINTTWQVVGSSYLPGDRAQHAFLYSDGTMTNLGTLGGTHSFAYGINAAGQVVGRSYLPGDLAHHVFRYRSCSGTMTDLNDLVDTDFIVTNATAINTAGQIVADGRIDIDGSPHVHALLLTPLLSDRFAYARVDESTIANGTLNSRYAYNAQAGQFASRGRGWGSMTSCSTACQPGARVCPRPWRSPPMVRPPAPVRWWPTTVSILCEGSMRPLCRVTYSKTVLVSG